MSDPYAAYPDVQPVAAPAAPGSDPYAAYPDVRMPPPMLAKPSPSVGEDMASGFAQPFVTLGHDVMQGYRNVGARATAPLPGPMQALKQAGSDLLGTGRIIGDVLGLASAPIQAGVRPVSRAIVRNGPQLQTAPQLSFAGGKPSMLPSRPMNDDEAQATVEGAINTALSGARPAKAPMLPGTGPMPLEDVQAAKTAAYKAADAAGVKYTPKAFGDMVNQVASDLTGARFNPRVHPAAASVLDDLRGLATQKGGYSPTLTDLDQLRQVVGRDVTSSPHPGEQTMGGIIKDAIDRFIDNPGPKGVVTGNATDAADLIKTARDLNTRFKKMEAVSDKVRHAELMASTANSGENLNNSVRRSLRPFIDPTSPQEMKNLSPDERAILGKVVEGTDGQNAMRWVSNVLRNKMLQAGVMWPTHGVGSAAMESIGQVAKGMSQKQTMKAVQQLLDTFSVGGATPRPMLAPQPVTRLMSPNGLTGVGVVAAPLARLPAPGQPARPMKQGAASAR